MATSRQHVPTRARALPDSVYLAVTCWSAAIAVAVVESAVAVKHAASSGHFGRGVVTETVVHLAVFALAGWLIVRLVNGSARARVGLAVLLSVIGVGSIVLPAVAEIATGSSTTAALGADVSPAFPWLRVAHVSLVVVATAAMYRRSASHYLREHAQRR